MAKKSSPTKKPNKIRTRDGRIVRKLQQPEYKPFRISKRIKHPGPAIPGVFKLSKQTLVHIWRHKRTFSLIAGVYLVLTLMLVRGFVITSDLSVAKEALQELLGNGTANVTASVTIFGLLLSSTNPGGSTGALYQSALVVVFSLMIIWTLRQTYARQSFPMRDVFYRTSYPLVPFLMIIAVIGLQLLPLVAASFLYNATIVSGLSVSFAEVFAWSALVFLLVLWSAYLITASIFALYIVTLPDMTPLQALRSAKKLVQHRRWTVMRKVLFVPLGLLVGGFVITLPVILIFTAAAEVVFLIATSFVLVLVHGYLYSLYRELLNE